MDVKNISQSDLWIFLSALCILPISIFLVFTQLISGEYEVLPRRYLGRKTSQGTAPAKLRTVRINEIPSGTTKESMFEQLKKMVKGDTELETMLKNAEWSRCTLTRISDRHACSTLEVHSSMSPKTIVRRFNKCSKAHHFRFDCDFRGITPLFEDIENATVDLIAVPGLSSHAIGSWSLSDDSGDCWLRDFVPSDLPNARVLIYGYDSKLDDPGCIDNIETMGSTLLQYLTTFRGNTNTNHRPIIFITHSLGGLILKEALLKAHAKPNDDECRGIARGCYALLMFGVPNSGLRNREELQTIVRGQANESFINDLVVDANGQPQAYLRNLTKEFAIRCKELYKVVCFCETKFTRIVQRQEDGQLAATGPAMLLVSLESATNVGLTHAGEQYNVIIQKDHSGLTKLERTNDYGIVLRILKRLSEQASSGLNTLAPSPEDEFHLGKVRHASLAVVPLARSAKSQQFHDTVWLLQNSEYLHWIGNSGSNAEYRGMITLWGGLGGGKTVLMNRAFEEAEQSHSSIKLGHFCSDSSTYSAPSLRNSRRGLLFSLFAQLLDKVQKKPWEQIRKLSQQLQASGDNIGIFSDSYLEDQIKALLIQNRTAAGIEVVTFRFFIDALEQYSSGNFQDQSKPRNDNDAVKNLLRFLTELIAMRDTDGVDIRICLSRRYTPTFGDLEPLTAAINLEDHTGPLVIAFIQDQLTFLRDESLLYRLQDKISRHASNSYLWATLLLERIKIKARSSSHREVMDMVNHLPNTMEKLYDEILDTLSDSCDMRAVRLLQIVLVAFQPLTIDQLRHALGFTGDGVFSSIDEWERSQSSEPKDDAFITRIRELTYGLLTTSPPHASFSFAYHEEISSRPIMYLPSSPVVSFAHKTMIDFLHKGAQIGLGPLAKMLETPQSNLTLLVACLRALDIFAWGDETQEFNFIRYACEFWFHHARNADDLLMNIEKDVLPSFVLQCDNTTARLLQEQKKLLQRSHAAEHIVLGPQPTGFMVHAAAFGCTSLIKLHLKKCRRCKDLTSTKVQVDLRDALYSSMTCRWYKTTEYLLAPYSEAVASIENDGFLLYKACYTGDIETVKFLVGRGANPSIRHTRGYELPLHAAIAKGQRDIILLLLKSAGANARSLLVQKRTRSGMTALHFVIDVERDPRQKHDILQDMLSYVPGGSDMVCIEDKNGDTPLSLVRKRVSDGQRDSSRLEATLLDFQEQGKTH